MAGNQSRSVFAAARFVGATAAVGAAAVLAHLSGLAASPGAPALLFTLAVLVATWFGGISTGLFATALSVWALSVDARSRTPALWELLALLALAGSAISWSTGRLRRALARASDEAAQRRSLAEAVPHLLWRCDSAGHCARVNERWIEYTGLTIADVSLWFDSVHPDDCAQLLDRWRAATSAPTPFETELRLRRRDGAWRWFELRVFPLPPLDSVAGWLCAAGDIDEAHRNREALRAQQQRFERIAATAPGVICSFRRRPDGSFCFPYASRRIQEIYGIDPEALAEDAAPIFALIHPGDLEYLLQTAQDSGARMIPWNVEFRVRHPNRGEIWVAGYAQPSREPDGGIEWHGFLHDVTERHRMEEQLRERSAALEAQARTLDLAHAFVRALDGSIIYWSQGAAAMYGWTREDAAGRNSHELLKTEFPAPLSQIEAALFASGRWEGDLRHYRRDGAPVDVASHWALNYDAAGNPRSIVEVNNDISGLKRVEQKLRASEERLALAQSAAGVAVWDWHISTEETLCSPAYGEVYGLPKSDHAPAPKEWIQLVHPDDREDLQRTIQEALDGVRPYDTEFRIVSPDGRVRWLMGKGQVHRDAAGKAVRMVGVNLDITERKTAAEKLRALSASLITAQEEERRRISRELHDDLVQRLALMAIDVGNVVSSLPLPPAALRDKLRRLQRSVVQSAELTRHIAHELHPLILDDLGIATALRALCADMSRSNDIEIRFEAAELPSSIGREVASCLYAVAREGLLNVAKHARATRAEVRLDGTGAAIHLAVADNGAGLTPGADQAGVGLGIVNMRERVRCIKGVLALESRPGGGTRLTVNIPVREDSRETTARSAG